MSILKVENLSFCYSDNFTSKLPAINNINLEINKGEILGIIGHTGSGKSTLVQHLNGLLKPDEGKVLLNGKNIWTEFQKINDVRFKVGLVFQYPEYQLFEETVAKDIAFGPTNMKLNELEINERVSSAAKLVELPSELLEKSPFELSGGEKRRVAIAGVIAMKPDVLVLDEPAAGLDPRGRKTILNLVKKYRDETGAAVVIVSHSMEDIALVADKVAVMSDGEIKLYGTPLDVFGNEYLENIGLDVPQITKVAKALREKGFALPQNIYTVDRLVESLLSLKGGSVND